MPLADAGDVRPDAIWLKWVPSAFCSWGGARCLSVVGGPSGEGGLLIVALRGVCVCGRCRFITPEGQQQFMHSFVVTLDAAKEAMASESCRFLKVRGRGLMTPRVRREAGGALMRKRRDWDHTFGTRAAGLRGLCIPNVAPCRPSCSGTSSPSRPSRRSLICVTHPLRVPAPQPRPWTASAWR
jgi:hypothetical protein